MARHSGRPCSGSPALVARVAATSTRYLRDQRQRRADRPTGHHPHGVRGRDHEPGGRLPRSDGGGGTDRTGAGRPCCSPTLAGPRSLPWCDHRRNRTHRRQHRHRWRPRRRRRPRLRPRRRVVLRKSDPRATGFTASLDPADRDLRSRRHGWPSACVDRLPGCLVYAGRTARPRVPLLSIQRRSSCPPTRPPSRRP